MGQNQHLDHSETVGEWQGTPARLILHPVQDYPSKIHLQALFGKLKRLSCPHNIKLLHFQCRENGVMIYSQYYKQRITNKQYSYKELKELLKQLISALSQYERLVGKHGSLSNQLLFLDQHGHPKLGLPSPGLLRDDQQSLATILFQITTNRPASQYWSGVSINEALIAEDYPKFKHLYGENLAKGLEALLSKKGLSQVYYMLQGNSESPTRRKLTGRSRSKSPCTKVMVTSGIKQLNLARKSIQSVISQPNPQNLPQKPIQQKAKSSSIIYAAPEQEKERPSPSHPVWQKKSFLLVADQADRESKAPVNNNLNSFSRTINIQPILTQTSKSPLKKAFVLQDFNQKLSQVSPKRRKKRSPFSATFTDKIHIPTRHQHILPHIEQEGTIPSTQSTPKSQLNQISTRMEEDGAIYTGNLKNGQKHGYGILQGKTLSYRGEWKQDLKHGKGSLFINGELTYEGDWNYNMMNGWGKFYACGQPSTPTGKRIVQYEGQFKNNRRHGFGKLLFEDGECYEGQFRDNRLFGSGVAKGNEKVEACLFDSNDFNTY